VAGVNFVATVVATYSISGTVTDRDSGLGVGGVTMNLFGSVSTNTTTNTSGNYTFRGLSNGTYTITPRKSDYAFELPKEKVTINNANVQNVNFTAYPEPTYTISGTVTHKDTGLAGVTITVLYDSVLGDTTTNTSGNYTFTGVRNGTYTVTPSKANYTFTPPSTQVTISDADVTGVNFTAFGACSTWADVYAKYLAYVNGEATWADVIDCYQEYTTQ
jgi:hypothetical protein